MSPEVYKSPEVGQEVPTPGVDASQLHEPDGPQALGQSVEVADLSSGSEPVTVSNSAGTEADSGEFVPDVPPPLNSAEDAVDTSPTEVSV